MKGLLEREGRQCGMEGRERHELRAQGGGYGSRLRIYQNKYMLGLKNTQINKSDEESE